MATGTGLSLDSGEWLTVQASRDSKLEDDRRRRAALAVVAQNGYQVEGTRDLLEMLGLAPYVSATPPH